MSLTRRSFALHLAMTPGIGGRSVVRILARNDLLGRTPEEFLALSTEALREEYRLNAKQSTNLAYAPEDRLEANANLERRLDGLGVRLITIADAGYPEAVEAFDPDPPSILFLYGNMRLLHSPTFAVLGSRNTLPVGLNRIEELTEEGVLAGETLVTGHDRPEYQRSAIVPLRWGAPRILVLDRGLFEVLGQDLKDEAFRAARLWRYEFDPNTDLAVSPFRPEARFIGANNQVRDRLVASLAKRIDFVNIAEGGNMARLARLGLKANRRVRLADGVCGREELIAAGAEPL
jgi:predicted Rossmann fold nucleotide-binding protein DprA/Smf involved in DNA uptake